MARQREKLAYHEAGHAVIARVLGVVVHSVTMVRSEGALGHTISESEAWKCGNARHAIELDIKVSLAGRWAQERAFPRSVRDWMIADDIANAKSNAARIAFINVGLPPPSEEGTITITTAMLADIEAILQAQNMLTKRLVDDHWLKIRRVAGVLLRREELDPSHLDDLIFGRC